MLQKYNNSKLYIGITIVIFFASLYIFTRPVFNMPDNNHLNAAGAFNSNNNKMTIKEAPRMQDSNSDEFWLSSGGQFFINGEYGRTIFGDLPAYSRWRLAYGSSNPTDTEGGYHPQNLLRLISRKKIVDSSQKFYFLIAQYNLSSSPNRNESNGVFTLNRYTNSDNLYYAGVRVDGSAVIKKKSNGIYHTLAQKLVFSGDTDNRNSHPNLIPKNQWIGIRSDVINTGPNSVRIELFLDRKNTGKWEKILEVEDRSENDIPAFTNSGHGGIRSDFMDLQIKDYEFIEL